ncbi:ycaO-like family protein [Desulfovibrio sp. A2]|nr:ycaO-like family protein [Desulfovibrio sp. A2]
MPDPTKPTASPAPLPTLHYRYTHTSTEATTGYFACEPPADMTFEQGLARLEAAPLDEFLHSHLLRLAAAFPAERMSALLDDLDSAARPATAALLREACLLNPDLSDLIRTADASPAPEVLAAIEAATPHIALRWHAQPDRDLHRAWCEVFRDNMHNHRMLPQLEDMDIPPLYDPAETLDGPDRPVVTAADIRAFLALEPAESSPWQRPPSHETASLALERLVENGIIAGQEMRHEASLSPIALLRRWNVDMTVRCGALDYTLKGEGTTYGRGLSLADARASYAMEMVERASSYVSVGEIDGQLHVLDRATPQPLLRARLSELLADGREALAPQAIPLEAPYQDQPLYWLTGHTPDDEGGSRPVLVPAQMAYLFCNLDEIALFSASGSTGLATGNIMAEAKVAALTEIIERDAEATMPYDRSQCFRLVTDDARLQSLLDDYAARGIHIQFQDLTTEFGVPCYKCFVVGPRGQVARGTGAGLSGRRAVLSAMTETPFPYPNGGPSGPGVRGLPERRLEDLPDLTLESPQRNLALLEGLFAVNRMAPVYVELTREDLEFPVVKALVPGLESTADFDTWSRMSRRLFRNYLRLRA